MEIKKLLRKAYLIFFLPLGVIGSYIASKSPSSVEKLYSNNIYKFIGQCLSRMTGVLPFSVGEFLLISIILFFIIKIIITIMRIIKKSDKKKYIFLDFILDTIVFISITYFIFIMVWGLNYHRLPFSEISNLDTRPSTTNELYMVCDNLIKRGNELREKISEDSSGVMKLSYTYQEVFKRASEGYERASNVYSELAGRYGSPKGVTLSRALSISGISGIYSPFTAEANVNIEIPDSMIPSTTCHEMAHQRGFAREDEANFIAYLTCNLHPDVEFQYSGTLVALIHSMNALYKYDKKKYIQLRKKYSPGIVRDLKFINKFWQSYEGPVERAANKVNNAYLKSNYQEDGIYSYGRMVDLLIAEYRAKANKNKED